MKFDDFHAHTSLSYCAEDPISPRHYVEAIERGGSLRRVAITNHGFALYFPEDLAWSWRYMTQPSLFDEHLEWGNRRFIPHLEEVEARRDRGLLTGIEVEMMEDGRLTVDPRLRDRLDVVVGSIHWLRKEGEPAARIADEWMAHTRALVRTGIDILGHPLRYLSNWVKPLPDGMVEFVVDQAAEAGVAVEINSHYVVEADLDLLLEADRREVPVVFSTDSHRFSEIGRFDYHEGLIARSGLAPEDLRLWTPERSAAAPSARAAVRSPGGTVGGN
jgi:histidinol phosphatase-like PHP family hydrolase